jgi:hypothetical protein
MSAAVAHAGGSSEDLSTLVDLDALQGELDGALGQVHTRPEIPLPLSPKP